ETDAEGVTFDVLVDSAAAAGEAGLIAQFVYRGRPSGRVARRWKDGKAIKLGDGADAASLHVDAVAPDLTLILSAPGNDGINFGATGLAPGVPGSHSPVQAPWALPAAAATYITQLLAGFVDRTRTPSDRRASLVGAGLQLFGAAPKAFREAIW